MAIIANPETSVLSLDEIRNKVALVLLRELGGRLVPGTPLFDTRARRWTAEIYSKQFGPERSLGQIVLSAKGELISFPSKAELEGAAGELRNQP